MESVPEVRAVPGKGLEGDRYFRGEGSFSNNPGGGRQVTRVLIDNGPCYCAFAFLDASKPTS